MRSAVQCSSEHVAAVLDAAALLHDAARSRGRPVEGEVAGLVWLTRLQVVLVVSVVAVAAVVVGLAV